MTQVTRFGSTVAPLFKALGYDPGLIDDTVDEPDPPDLASPDFAAGVEVPYSVSGSVALVQSDTQESTNTHSDVVATFPGSPVQGNLLLAAIEVRGLVTIVTPSGWALVRALTYTNGSAGSSENTLGVYYRIAGASEPTNVTIGGVTPANYKRCVVAEFSGVGTLDTTDRLDQQAAATSHATGAMTPTAGVPALVFAAFLKAVTDGSSNAFTPGTGYTELDDAKANASFHPRYEVEYQIVATTSGSYAPDTTQADSRAWAAIGAIFTALSDDDLWTVAPEVTDDNDATYDAVAAASASGHILRAQLADSYRIGSVILKIGASASGSRTIELWGDNDPEFGSEVLLDTVTYTATGSFTLDTVTFTPPGTTAYQYYRWASTGNVRIYTLNMYAPEAAGSSAASDVTYDNTTSGLAADDVQEAIDEIAGHLDEFELNTEGGQSVIQAHGSMGSTETFDPTGGNVHTGTLNANCTVTLNSPVGSGACTLELWLTEDGTGGWTVTWPGTVTEQGTHTTTLNTTSRVILETIDGGSSWIATWIGGGGSALTVEDEGTPLATAADTLDFVGAGVVASGTGATKTITISGAPTGSAGGDLSGTYPNPSVVDDSHSHTSATAPAGVGAILISDTPSTPLVFADLIQNEAQDDLVYADP